LLEFLLEKVTDVEAVTIVCSSEAFLHPDSNVEDIPQSMLSNIATLRADLPWRLKIRLFEESKMNDELAKDSLLCACRHAISGGDHAEAIGFIGETLLRECPGESGAI